MDSLLSIVQMPAGVPVATVSVGGARNAGLLAVRILGASDPALQERMVAFQGELREKAVAKGEALRRKHVPRRRLRRLSRADLRRTAARHQPRVASAGSRWPTCVP